VPEINVKVNFRNLVTYDCGIIIIIIYSPLLGLGRFFSFLILFTLGLLGRGGGTGEGGQSVEMPVSTDGTTQTQNKHTQTFMPAVGFESMTPMSEREKTIRALERPTAVIGGSSYNIKN
jgi:hypothetical protein